MKYLDNKIYNYLEDLRAKKPTPGGGAAAALLGAQAAALAMMVAEYTIGNEKYFEYDETCIGARANTSYIYMNLAMTIDQDAEAYESVAEARKMPQGTEQEKEARRQKLAEANLNATLVPFKVLRLCFNGMEAAEPMIGCSNPNLESDLATAMIMYYAGAKSAWINVLINMPSIEDEKMREGLRKEGEDILRAIHKIQKNLEASGLFPDFNPPDKEEEEV